MAGFRLIAEQIRRAIEDGKYPPGSRIPTEYELAGLYGSSRETIRRALALLKADGLLVTARSQGTFVRPAPVRLKVTRYADMTSSDRDLAHLGPWETACAAQGIDGQTVVTAVDRQSASQPIADRLQVPSGTQLVHRARQMLANGRVAQVQDTWMPADLVEGTPLAGSEKIVGGVYAAMSAAGFAPDHITEEVTARPSTSDERTHLQLDDGGPVLEVWRTTHDATGRAVEVLRIVASAELSTLVYDNLPIRRGDPSTYPAPHPLQERHAE